MKTTLLPIDHITLVEGPAFTTPAVLLHNHYLNRILAIFIGDPEASSIAIALQKIKIERPLTHDLILNLIKEMKGTIVQIVIDHISNHTYFAKILVRKNGEISEIDCRPSDAIAVAIRADVKIFVNQELLEKYGQGQEAAKTKKSEAKKDFSPEELRKMRKILDEARSREQESP